MLQISVGGRICESCRRSMFAAHPGRTLVKNSVHFFHEVADAEVRDYSTVLILMSPADTSKQCLQPTLFARLCVCEQVDVNA